MYYGSRFAPKPRKAIPSVASGPVRTVADGQDPDGIVCIRIRAHGFATGRTIRHNLVCFNDRYQQVLLSANPARELVEREALLTAMFAEFPSIDWIRDHQILIGPNGTNIWAAPEVLDAGFDPEEDQTFGGSNPVFLPCLNDHRRAAA